MFEETKYKYVSKMIFRHSRVGSKAYSQNILQLNTQLYDTAEIYIIQEFKCISIQN